MFLLCEGQCVSKKSFFFNELQFDSLDLLRQELQKDRKLDLRPRSAQSRRPFVTLETCRCLAGPPSRKRQSQATTVPMPAKLRERCRRPCCKFAERSHPSFLRRQDKPDSRSHGCPGWR